MGHGPGHIHLRERVGWASRELVGVKVMPKLTCLPGTTQICEGVRGLDRAWALGLTGQAQSGLGLVILLEATH